MEKQSEKQVRPAMMNVCKLENKKNAQGAAKV